VLRPVVEQVAALAECLDVAVPAAVLPDLLRSAPILAPGSGRVFCIRRHPS
jgi:hypothetical protein